MQQHGIITKQTMENQKQLHINVTWTLVKGLLLILANLLGKEGLIQKVKDLLDGNEPADAGLPVFEAAAVTQCDPGYHIENGKCVKDSPIPPDPTHP